MKNIKKKTIALFLMIALVAAMVLPASAAATPSLEPLHEHTWNATGPSTTTYTWLNKYSHQVRAETPRECKYCNTTDVYTIVYEEQHTGSFYCFQCGGSLLALLGETTDTDHEHSC